MKKLAQIISIVFHPVFMLSYMMLIIIWVNPYAFGTNEVADNMPLMLMVVFSTCVIPILAIAMMSALNLIDSIEMKSHKQRLIPLIATMVCYFSMYMFLMRDESIPDILEATALGVCIALSMAFVISVFYKISLHGMGAGSLWIAVLYLTRHYYYTYIELDFGTLGMLSINMLILLIITTVIAGLIMTARLIRGSHNRKQVYMGFVVGMLSQFVAHIIYLI